MKDIIVFLFFAFITSVYSQSTCPMSLGTNLEPPRAGVFKDLKLTSTHFFTRNIVYLEPVDEEDQSNWDSGLIDSITTDSGGYPLEVPFEHPSVDTSQVVAFTVGGYEMQYDTGHYVMLYEGEGTFDFAHWTYVSVTDQEPGRIEFHVDSVTTNGIHIEMLSSTVGNHVHDIRILKAEHELNYLSEPYESSFIDKLSEFSTIRFMDWASTNNNLTTTWSSRIGPQFHTQDNYLRGAAWEYMIDLANRTDKDIWINVPHLADVDYIDSLAVLFRDALETDRTIYLEYSNECWNYIFEQTYWIDSVGPYSGQMGRNYGYYALRVMERWESVFGNQGDRIQTVLAGTDYFIIEAMDYIIEQGQDDLVDLLSFPGYVSLNDRDYITLSQLGEAATADTVMDMLMTNMDSAIYWMNEFKELCTDAYDKPYVMYEGGQHLTPQWFGLDTSYNQALYDAQIDPRMYDFYEQLLTTLRDSLGVTLFAHFNLASPQESSFGSWGALENYRAEAPWPPKYQALLDFMDDCLELPCGVAVILADEDLTIQSYPEAGMLHIAGSIDEYDIMVVDQNGTLYHDFAGMSGTIDIDIYSMPMGQYFIELAHQTNPLISVELMLKE